MFIRKSFNFFVFCVFASGVIFASESLEQEQRWIVELKESIEDQELSVFKGCIGIKDNKLLPIGVNFAKKEAQVNSACVFPLTAALKTKLLSSNYPLLFIQDSWADKDVEDKNKKYYFQLNNKEDVKAFQEKLRAIDLGEDKKVAKNLNKAIDSLGGVSQNNLFWTPKKVVATSVTLCGLAFFAFMQYKSLSVAGILPFLKTLLIIKFAK